MRFIAALSFVLTLIAFHLAVVQAAAHSAWPSARPSPVASPRPSASATPHDNCKSYQCPNVGPSDLQLVRTEKRPLRLFCYYTEGTDAGCSYDANTGVLKGPMNAGCPEKAAIKDTCEAARREIRRRQAKPSRTVPRTETRSERLEERKKRLIKRQARVST